MTFGIKWEDTRFSRVVVVVSVVLVASAVALTFALGPMTKPLWSSLLVDQLTLYLIFWLVLCAGVWLASWRLAINFSAALGIAFALLLIVVVGVSAACAAAAIFIDALLIGTLIRGLESDEASAALLTATGLAVMALAANAAQLFPINYRITYAVATLLIPLLLLHPVLRNRIVARARRMLAACRPGRASLGPFPTNAASASIAGILGLHLLFALQPERYFDALAIHLYVPSYTLAHGRWAFDVESWAFAHMPLTIDFLYTWIFALGGEDAVRLYNFGALVLIAGTIVSWLRTASSNASPLVAAALFLATPLAFIETTSLFVENTLALWIAAAASLATTRWRTMRTDVSRTILVLLGATAASKLHGILAVALIGSVMLIGFARTTPSARKWLGFGVTTAIVGSLAAIPYLHAWIGTGNPVFPFFNQIFRSPHWPPSAFVDARWIGHFDWSLLWNATFHSSRFIEGYDGALGLSLLVFLPIACLVCLLTDSARDRLAAFIGLGLILMVASQIQYLRYFYIALPILFFVIGRLLDLTFLGIIERCAILGVASICIVASLFLLPSAGWILAASDLRADFDSEARRQLVLQQVPERLANVFINEVAGKCARVYYSGSPFPAFLQGTGLSSVWYNTRYAVALAGTTTPERIGELLRKMQINYVVLTPEPVTPLLAATTAYLKENGQLRATIGSLRIYELPPL